MTTKVFLQHIRQLIAQNELDNALQQLQHFLANTPQLDEVLHQSGRYAAIRKQIRLGLITNENAAVSTNQLRAGLLTFLTELEAQEKTPAIQQEMQAAVTILNSKNVISNSTISAGGNVHIGDNTTYTESEGSKRLRLWLFLLVPLLTLGVVYFWYQYQEAQRPFNLKVQIKNTTPTPHLAAPKGTLTLTYGGKPIPVPNISSHHTFEDIPSKYRQELLQIHYLAAGFLPLDTTISNVESIQLNVARNDDLATVSGYIFEKNDANKGIEGVEVRIGDIKKMTNENGRFTLSIPLAEQREKQRLYFSKGGYISKNQYEPIIKDEMIETYLEKQ